MYSLSNPSGIQKKINTNTSIQNVFQCISLLGWLVPAQAAVDAQPARSRQQPASSQPPAAASDERRAASKKTTASAASERTADAEQPAATAMAHSSKQQQSSHHSRQRSKRLRVLSRVCLYACRILSSSAVCLHMSYQDIVPNTRSLLR